jgi:hypothetical protein
MPEGPERDKKARRSAPKSQALKKRRWPPAGSTSSVPSATKAAASTTSCAAVPAVRATRALQVLPVAAGRPDAHLRLRAHGRDAAEARPQGRRSDHPSLDQQGAGKGAAKVEARNFDIRKNLLKYRRRHERPAQGRLRAAHGTDGQRSDPGNREDMRHDVIDDLVAKPHSRTRLSPSSGTPRV